MADAAVALGHQAGHQLKHGRGFIHHHADAAVRMLGRDAGERHMVRFKEFQHHRIVRQGRNEHHAVRREVLEHHLQVVHLALARGPHRRHALGIGGAEGGGPSEFLGCGSQVFGELPVRFLAWCSDEQRMGAAGLRGQQVTTNRLQQQHLLGCRIHALQ